MNRLRSNQENAEEPELNAPAPLMQISMTSLYEYMKQIDGKLDALTESVNCLAEASKSRKRKSSEVFNERKFIIRRAK